MCEDLGIRVEWCIPGDNGPGSTYERDLAMVGRSSWVEVFFAEDAIMEGGTGHVVESAMTLGIPCYAWSVDERGRLNRVGEWEPEPV